MRRTLGTALLTTALTLTGASAIADDAVYNAPPGSEGKAPYSEAVTYDDFIFLAGQLGIVPGTRALAEGGIGPETKQALDNMQAAYGRLPDAAQCDEFVDDPLIGNGIPSRRVEPPGRELDGDIADITRLLSRKSGTP